MPVFTHWGIWKELKMKLVKALIWPVITYGAEGWTLKKDDERRLEAAEMWCYRRMLQISWTEKRTNVQIPIFSGLSDWLHTLIYSWTWSQRESHSAHSINYYNEPFLFWTFFLANLHTFWCKNLPRVDLFSWIHRLVMASPAFRKYSDGTCNITTDCKVTNWAILSTESEKVHRLYFPQQLLN